MSLIRIPKAHDVVGKCIPCYFGGEREDRLALHSAGVQLAGAHDARTSAPSPCLPPMFVSLG